jgi:hypothetical protein
MAQQVERPRMDDQRTDRAGGGISWLVRAYCYCHFGAALLSACGQYWDSTGSDLFRISVVALYSLPIMPAVLMWILCSPKIDRKQKQNAAIVGVCATILQVVATIPLIQ